MTLALIHGEPHGPKPVPHWLHFLTPSGQFWERHNSVEPGTHTCCHLHPLHMPSMQSAVPLQFPESHGFVWPSAHATTGLIGAEYGCCTGPRNQNKEYRSANESAARRIMGYGFLILNPSPVPFFKGSLEVH